VVNSFNRETVPLYVVETIKLPVEVIKGALGPSPSKSLEVKITGVPPPSGVNVTVTVVITSSSLTGWLLSSFEQELKESKAIKAIDVSLNVFMIVNF
jgi:hypothetical protein